MEPMRFDMTCPISSRADCSPLRSLSQTRHDRLTQRKTAHLFHSASYRGNVDARLSSVATRREAVSSSASQSVPIIRGQKEEEIWRRLSFRFRAVLTIALGSLRSGLASVKP